MSGINFQRLKQTAERLTGDNGRIAYIVRTGEPTGPEWNPQPGVEVKHSVWFVPTSYSLTNRNNSLVEVGDRLGLISTEGGIIPDKSSDKFEDRGQTYSFIDVKSVEGAELDLLFKIHARK